MKMNDEYANLLYKKIDFLEKENKSKIKKYKNIILFLIITLFSCFCFYFYDNPKKMEAIINAINLSDITFIDILKAFYILSMVYLFFFIQYKTLLKMENLSKEYDNEN